jgi:hypothetical protein
MTLKDLFKQQSPAPISDIEYQTMMQWAVQADQSAGNTAFTDALKQNPQNFKKVIYSKAVQ